MKKLKRQIVKLLAAAIVFGVLTGNGQSALSVKAAQDAEAVQENEDAAVPALSENGLILKVEKDVDMKAEPEKSAETLKTFEQGSLVFAMGEATDGWYHVLYQGMEGYVEEKGLSVQELDVEGLDAEMAASEAETKLVMEVVEKYREDARRSKIWGTIIVVLVAGIFGIGIFSVVRSNKSGDNEEKNDEGDSGTGTGHSGKRKKERDNRKKRESEKRKDREMKIEDLN